MSARQSTVSVCGFGLRLAPLADRPFRIHRSGGVLVIECQRSEGWRSVTIIPDDQKELSRLATELVDVAHIQLGPSGTTWWIEAPTYRIPLPSSWALHSSGDRNATPLFELLGANESSISVRTSRRMPALESFQGVGHTFRDIGQLDRAGFIEFEHADASRTWLHRHEQFHRGTTPFVVTLKAPLEQAATHMATLASIVEQLELSQ